MTIYTGRPARIRKSATEKLYLTANRSPPIKAHPKYKEELEDIRLKRIQEKTDREMRSYRRLTLAQIRHPLWQKIKEDMIKSKFLKDEDGQFSVFNLFTFMIISFVVILLFAGLIYVMGLLNTTFQNVGLQNEINSNNPGYVNMTLAAQQTFGQVNTSVQSLRLVALTLIFSIILSTIFINGLQKIHPAFFFVYVLIVVLAIIFSAPISNAYQNLLASNIFDGLLPSFTGANWIMLNLPLVTTITGLLGGLFLFINIIRTGTEEVLS